MKKMFVGNLPPDASEATITEWFAEYGKVFSIKVPKDVFSGRNKGIAFVAMEGHEARAAIAGLDGKLIGEKNIKVRYEDTRRTSRRRH